MVTVGIHRGMGGAIAWLSWTGHPQNVVNHHDPGRLIQQSYYAGHPLDRKRDGQSPHWSPWPWNPVQAGGVGAWALARELRRLQDGALYSETVPKLWDMPNEDASALMRQWIHFEPDLRNVVAVRCEFLACRDGEADRWGRVANNGQEIPACYFVRKFDRFRTYLGDGRWRAEPTAPGPPWGRARPPLNAVAVFDDDGQGVAVFSPAATQPWNYGPHGADRAAGPADAPCVHLAPIDVVPMGPHSTYRYRFWLVVGTENEIATSLDALRARYGDHHADFEPAGKLAAPATSSPPPTSR
ncbi:MAG: hypothetical protein N2652_11305 [Kiritimatiellae bacterium]|nr:hypothetical protein [Kiritimatiellia bacterium]